MKLYLAVIGCAMLIVSAIVSLIKNLSFLYVFAFTAVATAMVIAFDGLFAGLCRALPKRCADYTQKRFCVSAKEKSAYEKMKIRKWKDKVPEIGHLTGFRKNKLAQPQNAAYVKRFLTETCYGEIVHFVGLFTGICLLPFFFLTEIWFAVALPVACINAALNFPMICIQRYNRYKLTILHESLLRKEKRAKIE